MAALESTQFVQLHFPLSNQPFYNRKLSGLLNPAVQSLHSTPAAAREYTGLRSPFPRSGYQIEAERNTAARAKGTWTSYTESEFVLCALADNDDESDDDLPFLEEQSRATLRPKISTEASNAGSPPFSVSNSQLFTAPDCKSTEHNHGQVNVRVVVEAGAPAVPHAQKRSANYMQINQ